MFILPYTRLELPGWGKLYKALGGAVPAGSSRWNGAPVRVIRGKTHGFRMELHLDNWSERMSYFLGRYYEMHIHILLAELLDAGDRFVDIGGNIGMVSLIAARHVGPQGKIDIFEPNPVCQERMRRMFAMNDLNGMRIHPVGVSDAEATLELTVTDGHTGVGTFGKIENVSADRVQKQLLKVVVGDNLLLTDPKAVKLIKIDVEGFETRALRGLRKTLQRDHPMIVTETIDAYLRRAGSSIGELFDFMTQEGYRAWNISLQRRGWRYALDLCPATKADNIERSDTLWLHRDHEDVRKKLAAPQAPLA